MTTFTSYLLLYDSNSASIFGLYISHIVNREYPVLPQSSLTCYVTSTARRVLDIAKLTSEAR